VYSTVLILRLSLNFGQFDKPVAYRGRIQNSEDRIQNPDTLSAIRCTLISNLQSLIHSRIRANHCPKKLIIYLLSLRSLPAPSQIGCCRNLVWGALCALCGQKKSALCLASCVLRLLSLVFLRVLRGLRNVCAFCAFLWLNKFVSIRVNSWQKTREICG